MVHHLGVGTIPWEQKWDLVIKEKLEVATDATSIVCLSQAQEI
jgi:hypothetical protein